MSYREQVPPNYLFMSRMKAEDYKHNESFEKENYAELRLDCNEYEGCVFNTCSFVKADLSSVNFISCKFNNSDISLANISNTAFKDCVFENCKLVGLDFSSCNDFLFEIQFFACVLDYSVFIKKKLKKTTFSDSSLKEVDFSDCDLSNAGFDNCNLENAIFHYCNLEKTNFTTSYNYTINPEQNRMRGAKFSLQGLPGLLTKYNIEIR